MTATATDAVPLALTRDNFRFSPGGATAACVAGDDQGGLHLEAWSFAGPSPQWWPLPVAGAVTPHMQPIPLDDGRVLLWRERALGENGVGALEIVLLEGREPSSEQVLGVIRSDELVALRLLPGPGTHPVSACGQAAPTHLAVAIAVDNRGCSTIWRVAADPPHVERLAEVPGVLFGGVWLDSVGRLLGVDRAEGDGPAKPVAVDLADGSCTPLVRVRKASNDRLLACDARSGLLVVSTDAAGEERLGWGRLGASEPVRFPETLHPAGRTAYPLAFAPDGQRVLLHLDEGARSRLAVYTPSKDQLAPVETPTGVVHGGACWANGVLRFPFSTPCQPVGVATVCMGHPSGWSVAGSAPPATGGHWADAHIEWLDGAAGPVEAIVYGGQGWRANSRLLLALHGGPVEAWRFAFDPLFQRLAAAGIAVVAVNQRGSRGYGAAHTRPVIGAWGGPDLDDVCCIARGLVADRRGLGVPGLMLFGISYGAFLALLAASCQPDLWSRCAVLAPFLSGPRLLGEAGPAVQGLVERMGGAQELCDEVGPRDVLRLCHALRAQLLVVHSERDGVIPVTQSRALRQRLLALGRREGVDFAYLEVPDSRHDLTAGAHTQALHERLVRFLAAGVLSTAHTAAAWADASPFITETRRGGEYP
ncbi:MAG: alpha/beta hydrolase family protein [Egibacteraceae bacterium]